jgi:hypothetical protein
MWQFCDAIRRGLLATGVGRIKTDDLAGLEQFLST